jgi:hypothetical protein
MTERRDEGQVSEVGRLAPDQAGPDAIPADNRRDVEGETTAGADKTP